MDWAYIACIVFPSPHFQTQVILEVGLLPQVAVRGQSTLEDHLEYKVLTVGNLYCDDYYIVAYVYHIDAYIHDYTYTYANPPPKIQRVGPQHVNQYHRDHGQPNRM